MNIRLLYAPMLLFTLSLACGKTDSNKKQANPPKDEPAIENQELINGETITETGVISSSGDKQKEETKTVVEIAASESKADVEASDEVKKAAEAAKSEEASKASEVEPLVLDKPKNIGRFAGTVITTDAAGVNTLCATSFKVLAALYDGDQETAASFGITPQKNATCLNVLNGVLGDRFAKLGFYRHDNLDLNFGPGINLDKKLWTSVVAEDKDFAGFLLDTAYAKAEFESLVNFTLVDAEISYLEEAIAEKSADPAAALDVLLLTIDLESKQAVARTIAERINFFIMLGNMMALSLELTTLQEQLLAPPPAPAPAADPATPVPAEGAVVGSEPSAPDSTPPQPAPEPVPAPAV